MTIPGGSAIDSGEVSHDQNFKHLILDFLHESIRFFAGEEGRDIPDDARITPLRQEQPAKTLGKGHRELDVPLLVEFPDHRREAIAFALEEETRPARFSIRRLAHYCLDLSEQEDMTRIVPVVVFLRSGNADESLRLGTERATYLSFSYVACYLARLNALDYVESGNVVARILLPTMRAPAELRVTICVKAMQGLITLVPDDERLQRKYTNFVGMYAGLKDDEMVELTEVLQGTDWGRPMIGFLDHARLKGQAEGKAEGRIEGKAEGRIEGKAEGRIEGKAESILLVLKTRGIVLSQEAESKVMTCTEQALLDEWLRRALTATSLDEVFDARLAH